ncbi:MULTISPECIES: PH domain-containing protein [Mycobacteriaceae]|uniref:PH domain-containing protein n=1 Tax=Mycolicibacterium parafortuitum TaxID=39692 RepID=A0ACC6MH52_MYCPF|nr:MULTISPECIES: PH domain-containing protein [Mycobacteriaceae]MDZ5086232.1 PH domain-containing protein [Mycolicibacterium parafortuitum]GFM19217.1 low molecular weight protein antigen 6 cfp6 [Mycobacterium sp. PO1]
MDTPSASGSAPESTPVVIKISPMAHIAVLILAFAMLSIVLAGPPWWALLLLIPVFASVAIVRYRTSADRDGVTARTLLSSRAVRWDDIAGLRFGRRAWALARLHDGTEVPLPAVTFATLPLLTAASDGRVPNPYS